MCVLLSGMPLTADFFFFTILSINKYIFTNNLIL